MNLKGEERKQFREALTNAFPEKKDLEIMLSEELEWNLDEIISKGNNTQIIFDLIRYAESQGKLVELLEAAKRYNPGNSKLNDFAKKFNTSIVEQDSQSLQIYQALLSLNYEKQVEIFEKYWQMSPQPKVGSFLISGEPKNGQKWLVNRLLHLNSLPDTTTAKKVSVSLNYNEKYIEDVWPLLRRELKSSSASPKELIKLIYKHWQTKTVIIVIHDLELMEDSERTQIIERFWQPLVETIQRHSQPCDSHLIMFLVYNEVCTNNLKVDWNKLQASEPLAMEPLETFNKNILYSWVNQNKELLNFPEESEKLDELAELIWKNGVKGTPEIVMDEICKHCNCSWDEMSKQLAL